MRRTLGLDVRLAEGHYGEFAVLVDDEEVFNAGTLAFLGVMPSKRRVRELVLEHLRKTGRAPSESDRR